MAKNIFVKLFVLALKSQLKPTIKSKIEDFARKAGQKFPEKSDISLIEMETWVSTKAIYKGVLNNIENYLHLNSKVAIDEPHSVEILKVGNKMCKIKILFYANLIDEAQKHKIMQELNLVILKGM